MNKLINAWSRLVVRFRWPIILLIPLLVVGLSAPAANIYFAHSPDMWFKSDDPVNTAYQKLKERFGDSQYLLVGVSASDGSGVIGADTLEAVRSIHHFLLDQEQIAGVQSLANYQYITSADETLVVRDLLNQDAKPYELVTSESQQVSIGRSLLDDPVILHDLITEDLKHTVLLAETFYEKSGRIDQHVAVVNALKEYLDVQQFKDKGISVEIFGRPYISHQLTSGNVRDQMIMYPMLFLATMLLLAVVFRKTRPMIYPWMLIVLGVLVVYTVQGAARWPTTVANASMPFLVVILGIGMSVHVMVDYYRNVGKGNDSKESARLSIQHLIKPAFFTTLTTVFGFVGLSVTRLEPLRQYGLLAIIGVVTCFLLSMTLLPALMSFCKKAPKWVYKEQSAGKPSTMVARLVNWSASRALPVATLGIVLMIAAIAMTASLKMDTNFVKIFKEKSEFRQAFDYFDREFQGGQAIEFVLDSGATGAVYEPEFLRSADQLSEWIDQLAEMGKPTSALNYIKQMNKALNNDDEAFWVIPSSPTETAQLLLLYENSGPERGLQDFIDPDNRYLRISARASNMPAVETQALVQRINDHISEAWPSLSVEMTGDLILYNKLENHIAEGMIVSFGVALSTIALCLFGLFRRIGLTLLALIPSVFPIFVAGAVMKLMGIFPDINSLIIASVTIGIAVDDTIHFLVRYEEARAVGRTPREAISIAADRAGKAILLSTIVLLFGFAVFLFSTLMSGVYFGLLSLVVIGVALIGDLVFLPALLQLTDKRVVIASTGKTIDNARSGADAASLGHPASITAQRTGVRS